MCQSFLLRSEQRLSGFILLANPSNIVQKLEQVVSSENENLKTRFGLKYLTQVLVVRYKILVLKSSLKKLKKSDGYRKGGIWTFKVVENFCVETLPSS